jgi:hypothetical protein
MIRGGQASHERAPFGSLDLLKVRAAIVPMINAALDDPLARNSDSTLISVLHLLCSEVPGSSDSTMRIHQRGLLKLVKQRGGLDRLGVGGSLASMMSM